MKHEITLIRGDRIRCDTDMIEQVGVDIRHDETVLKVPLTALVATASTPVNTRTGSRRTGGDQNVGGF